MEPGHLDAHRFAALLTRARERFAQDALAEARTDVTAALALWRGEPYADVRAGVVDAEVTRLEALRLTAVELAAELDLALGRHAQVAERLPLDVAEHPLRESLRGSLVLALYRCGEQARALEVYEQGREVLAEELGIDPSPQLQRLHALVLRQDPALDPPPAARPTRPTRPARPVGPAAPAAGQERDALVGRSAEIAACGTAWRSAAAGTAGVLALVGEAGIGKTRLAEEVGHQAAADGGLVAWGRCLDGTGAAPYAAWRQVVRALADARPEAVERATSGAGAGASLLLEALRTGDEARGPAGSPEAARTALFEGLTALLRVVADSGPLLVVLEDLHWADPETVLLTEHVAAHLVAAPVCLLLTVRDPEGRGALDGGCPSDRVLALVSRLPGAVRVDLEGLSPQDVQRYAVQALDAPVALEAAQRLHARTNGNPFFIAELVRLLGEERASRGRADVEVPRSVQAVLERRLAHLGAGLSAVLSAAAVLGRDLDVRLLAGVLGRSPLDLVDDLDTATAAGVVRPAPEGGQQFTHALVQEVLLAATGPMRRAALHARAADVLEVQHAGDLARVASQLAHHHVAAGAVGDPERAVRACLLAAEVAEAEAAHDEAEQHLRTALEQLGSVPGSVAAELELEVRVRLGSLLTLLHGYSGTAVAAERRRALELVAQVGTAEHALSALWGAWGVALVSGDFPAAEQAAFELAQAAQRRQDDVLLLAHHHALGQVRMHQGRLPEAAEHLHRAGVLTHENLEGVNLAVFLQHPVVTAPAWLAFVLTLLGDDDAAHVRAEEARRAAVRLGHDYTSAYLTILEGWRCIFRRAPAEALATTEAGMAISREQGFDQLLAFALAPHGWGLAHTGRTEEGLAESELGLQLFSQLPGGHMFDSPMVGVLAEVLAAAGRHEEALAAAQRAVADADRTGERFYLPAVHLQVAALAERTGAAADVVARHREMAERTAEETGAVGLLRRDPSSAQERASTTWSTHAVSAETSCGSTAGNMPTRSWLPPSPR
ncbi:BTAD domain-containing putative transcriptional regulator [Streptomyces sp. NP160]|uniref:ATP-binding protein n=1 Tax=Streptomyces sp. NP160 TaxID=2586637 RepID=UPI0015D5CDC7|nr:BTAD domain-containing putative transcriptional regulator [Streptomyces sp. NP160]